MRRKWTWLAVLVTVVLLGASNSDAIVIYKISGNVIANGGTPGPGITGVSNKVFGTAGQAAVGVSNGPAYILCHGFWCFGGSRVVAVDPGPPGIPPASLPVKLEFGPPVPNPARGEASFTLALPKAAEVRFEVFDVRGRQVGEPVTEHFDAGYHRVTWSPSDGGAARAGVYFARVWVDGTKLTERRVVLLD
jgi:hypothetical protein